MTENASDCCQPPSPYCEGSPRGNRAVSKGPGPYLPHRFWRHDEICYWHKIPSHRPSGRDAIIRTLETVDIHHRAICEPSAKHDTADEEHYIGRLRVRDQQYELI